MKRKHTIVMNKRTKLKLVLAGLVVASSLTLISYVVLFSNGRPKQSTGQSSRGEPILLGKLSDSMVVEANSRRDAGDALKTRHSRNSRETDNAVPVANENAPPAETDFTESEVSTPVAFVDPSPGQALTEEQVTEFDFMRQEFVELVGGANQDPSDPHCLLRWEYARQQLDDEFRAFFGDEAFNQQQLQAVAVAGQDPVGP
jgi:type II secretory pathway component PulC